MNDNEEAPQTEKTERRGARGGKRNRKKASVADLWTAREAVPGVSQGEGRCLQVATGVAIPTSSVRGSLWPGASQELKLR